jgi:hypothetical protein
MPMDASNLVLNTQNILRQCASGFDRVSCSVHEPGRSEAQLAYMLTCSIEGQAPTFDEQKLLEMVEGERSQYGGYIATICGERHNLHVSLERDGGLLDATSSVQSVKDAVRQASAECVSHEVRQQVGERVISGVENAIQGLRNTDSNLK